MIYYKDGQKMMLPVLSREEYMAIRNGGEQRERVKRIRNGEEALKHKLVQMNYSCLPNEDGTLRGSTRMSTTVGMDIDHIKPEEMQATRDRILSKKDELGLLMLEESARGAGYHLVFKRRRELSQEDNLKWASNLLKVEYDAGAKDITRVFFTTTAAQLIYLDNTVFEINEVESSECRVESQLKVDSAAVGGDKLPLKGVGGSFPDNYHGIPYQKIVEAWLEGKKVKEGDRHRTSLILADHLRYITDNNAPLIEQILRETPFVMEIIGERNEDVAQTVKSAQGFDFLKGIPKRMQLALKRAGVEDCDSEEHAIAVLPPEMPAKLPKLVQLLTSKTPDVYKAAVAHAIFPPLATHLCQVRFCYTDNNEYEATLMNCLMAGTGSGKSCIDQPIKHIMADIERRDKENERREDEWKKDCQKKGANKDKLLRPEGLVIQIIDPDMTKPALVTRMDESEGHFVYVKLNELDLFEQLKGQTGKQHFQLMCLAFDTGSTYGQTRIGTSSVTARPECRFNWNACTTILKGRRFFRNVLTDGPISRINFCTIPEQEIGAEQPIYGRYDAEFDEALKPYIDNLVAARGLIDCPQAFKLAKKLLQECAEFARLSQSDVYWNLSHRACVIAWLKACVLYVANGQKWEKSIEDFIRWSLNYDLWCKMQFFGADIERANKGDDARIGTRGPRNLLELLPDVFTLDDAKRVRQQQGMSNENRMCQKMISQWLYRKYVLQITDYSYQKNEKFLSIEHYGSTWN
jgi:hypothetical protein